MKKTVFLFVLIIAMVMMVTACGKENDTEESVPGVNVINIEDIEEEISTEDAQNAAWESEISEMEVDGSMEPEKEDVQANNTAGTKNHEEEVNPQSVEPTTELPAEQPTEPAKEQPAEQQPAEQPKEQPTEQQSTEQSQQQTQAEQTVPTATLNGRITSVGNGEFEVRKADLVSSDVMVSKEGAKEVSVIYSDKTEFVLCTTSDGGITANYSAASSSNLSSDKLVEITGAYEGNSFVAQKVTIYNFN